jgi:hypothetical protein
MSPVRYELGIYIPEDGILRSHCRENLKTYISLLPSGKFLCSLIKVAKVSENYPASIFKEKE